MPELTLILSDVYGPSPGFPALEPSSAPALDTLLRFSATRDIPQGWRHWLAERVGRHDLVTAAPAVVAAAGLATGPSAGPLWLASAVHLQAALDHVRMASGARLAVGAEDAARLAADFAAVFGPSGLALHPLGRGNWVLSGLTDEPAETTDPARAIGADVGPFLPRGLQARGLRRLGSEIELWLHAHPVNAGRIARGLRPVSALWLWGGGGGVPSANRSGATVAGTSPRAVPALPDAYGEDPFLAGLWRVSGSAMAPLGQATAAFIDTHAGGRPARPETLVEIPLFGEDPTVPGVAQLEERWLVPALDALRHGRLGRVTLVANDRVHALRRADLWKFWRRSRTTAGAGS